MTDGGDPAAACRCVSVGDDKPHDGADRAQDHGADDGGHDRVRREQVRREVADLQVELGRLTDDRGHQEEAGVDHEPDQTHRHHRDRQRDDP